MSGNPDSPSLLSRSGRFLVRVGNWRLISIVRWLAVFAVVAVVVVEVLLFGVVHYPRAHFPPPDKVDRVVYLGQGWGPDRTSASRQDYYYTPQGTAVKDLRYEWFVQLEKPWSNQRFAAPENLTAFGFIVDERTPRNPDQLPVGFTRRYDTRVQDYLLDITCAACHTGELHYTRKIAGGNERVAVRIDGGQASHAFTSLDLGQFGPSLLGSMAATYVNPFKFNSFAHRVLGDRYDAGKDQLRRDFGQVFKAIAKQGYIDKTRHLYPVAEGFGRTDAIGRISNQVFGTSLDEANYSVADAPVSYPPVWNIWKFDWVQYTASVSQPLARNLGETLGVGANPGLVDRTGAPVLKELRFVTSAEVPNLVKIERTLWNLQQPEWPEEVFGAINHKEAEAGRELYVSHCARCHQPCAASPRKRTIDVPGRAAGDAYWQIRQVPLAVVGTDPTAAQNFYKHRVDLSKTGMTNEDIRPFIEKMYREQQRRAAEYDTAHQLPVTDPEADIQTALRGVNVHSASIGAGLNYLGILMRDRYYGDHGTLPTQQAIMNGDGALDLPQVVLVYKARPLGGMWATPPYLHNGSVATLYELLSPLAERRKRFFTGSKDFDANDVGIPMKQPDEQGFAFDATIVGNLNIGHEFRAGYKEGGPPQYGVIGPELEPNQRRQIIEYLKIHKDDDDAVPACRTYPTSGAGK